MSNRIAVINGDQRRSPRGLRAIEYGLRTMGMASYGVRRGLPASPDRKPQIHRGTAFLRASAVSLSEARRPRPARSID
jgi:hypothetical protein